MFKAIREAFGTRSAGAIVVLFVVAIVAAPVIVLLIILGFLFRPLEWGCSRAFNTMRGVGQRFNDPVFGPVTYQGGSIWHAERELDALGGRLVIEIPGSRTTGPSQAHHDHLRGLVEHQHEIGRQVQESLFRAYQAVAPALRDRFVVGSDWISETFRESLPDLDHPDQIWALLSDGHIALDDQPGCFSITWYCTWESAYGDVTKSFVNWKIEEDEGG